MSLEKQNFLKSKFFQISTQILLPIIAIMISVYLFIIGKEQKELTVTGIQVANLIEAKNEVSNNIFVTYKQDTIYNTVRFLLEIKNTGNKSVVKTDVYKFYWIAPTDYQIVDINLLNSELAPISYTIIKPDSLKIEIATLNKNNSSQLSILCLTKRKTVFGESKLNAIISDCNIIDNVNEYRKPIAEPFWKTVFSGSLLIQCVKIVVYFIVGIILIIVILIPIGKFKEISKKREEKKNIQNMTRQLSLGKEISVKYPSNLMQTYKLLKRLTVDEINVIHKIAISFDYSKDLQRELIVNRVLSEKEKTIFLELIKSDNSQIIKAAIDYKSIYYTERLIEFFKTGAISKPFEP